MIKSITKRRKSWHKTLNKRLRRKKRKTVKKKKYGGNGENEKVTCCMCGKEISEKNPKIPSGCYMKHGKFRAHKICDDCWWNKFAKEGVNHQCPGCATGKPLNGRPIDNSKVIDLTEDD